MNVIKIFLLLLLLTGCFPNKGFDPQISYLPKKKNLQNLPSAFPTLSPSEKKQDFGKELMIGQALAKDFDLYRAISCYKRSLILMPKLEHDRQLQANYALAFTYYLGRRYCDVLESFELSELRDIPVEFPAFRDLAIILYESYQATGQCEKACSLLGVIKQIDPEAACNLVLFTEIVEGRLPSVTEQVNNHCYKETMTPYLAIYNSKKKSVSKAQFLNAILPGAGYAYVGQCKSGITSFIMNALFIAATVQFAKKDFIAAAVITGSLEMGWYVGGINGAGLAAKEYNERLYECQMKEMMIHHRLFPILMLQTAF